MKLATVLVALIGCVPFLLIACGSPAQPPATPARDQARAALLTIAEGVKVADKTCADASKSLQNAKLARDCADAYDAARAALVTADDGIDAWDDGSAGKVACAGKHALDALVTVENELAALNVHIPAAVVDAVKLGETFAPICTEDAGTKDVAHE